MSKFIIASVSIALLGCLLARVANPAIGEFYDARIRAAVHSLDDAVEERVTHKGIVRTVEKFQNAEAFLSGQSTSKQGDALEAILAHDFNSNSAGKGRMVLTHLHGDIHSKSDLLLLDDTGKVLEKYQLKRTLQLGDLRNPVYADMKFVTTQESYEYLHKRALSKERSCLRRGLPLPEEYRKILDGTVCPKLLSGKSLPTYGDLEKVTSKAITKSFSSVQNEKAINTVAGETVAAAAKYGNKSVRLNSLLIALENSRVIRVGGQVLGVAGYVTDGYLTAQDWQRYSSGAISSEHFALVGGIRAVRLSAELVLIYSPEPIMTRAGAVVVIVVSIPAEILVEHIYEGKYERQRQLLESVEIKARYECARDLIVRSEF